MHIIITGHKGRVGSRLAEELSPNHTITGIDLPEVDLVDPAVVDHICGLNPDLVVNCAAWTDVDGCARDPEKAITANAFSTKHVALACQRLNAPLLHISTNEVFDGTKRSTYLEYDRPNPINPYGQSKWVAEQIVQELVPQHYIVRISWLIAHGGKNFVHAILNRAQQDLPISVVINELGSPTYNEDLAPALAQLIETQQYGIYHLINEGYTSRWGLARHILDEAGYSNVAIGKITLAEFSRPSTVPERAVLKNMTAAHLGITLRPWQEAVSTFIRKEGLT